MGKAPDGSRRFNGLPYRNPRRTVCTPSHNQCDEQAPLHTKYKPQREAVSLKCRAIRPGMSSLAMASVRHRTEMRRYVGKRTEIPSQIEHSRTSNGVVPDRVERRT